MLIRYSIWRPAKGKKEKEISNRKVITGKLILRNKSWTDDNTHEIIKARIRKKYPGYFIEGYVNCSYKPSDERVSV